MTLLKEVTSVAGICEFMGSDSCCIGTKDSGGIGFDDYGGELSIHSLNLQDTTTTTPPILGSVKTTSRFASLAYSPMTSSQSFSAGLIAGGMLDGTVNIWDPALINSKHPQPQLATISRHTAAPVPGLAFNPHPTSSHLLASGGSDGDVFIMSLERPDAPNVFVPAPPPSTAKHQTEIGCVQWNTQVAHIVATGDNGGNCIVWDLRQKKPWCELRDPSRCALTTVSWNPTEGLHLVTATSSDSEPVLKLWDLRSSTTMPLATLSGHTGGVLSADWNPHDPRLLVSSGKDGRTILWDLFDMKACDELPPDEPEPTANVGGGMFGGVGRSQQKRYSVKWAPDLKGVLSTCSFDRKVQVHSMVGGGKGGGRAPNWLEKKGGVGTAFGGKIVSFNKKTGGLVTVKSVVESPQLVAASNEFEGVLKAGDSESLCGGKAGSYEPGSHMATVWGFMRITFMKNAREELVKYLGFDCDEIEKAAANFEGNQGGDVPDMSRMSLSTAAVAPMSKAAEETVSRALLVGNFAAAVECCFQTGQLADALILSSCGGADLWQKTQERYFEREKGGRPFLKVVNAVINNRLDGLVEESDLLKWQETLAILSTYGKSEEFPQLCEQLGARLNEAGDVKGASLCYVCALNLEKSLQFWKAELEEANRVDGGLDIMALHQFVEKATVFASTDPNAAFGADINDLFAQYADALANQGLFEVAGRYAKSQSGSCAVLRDRLYNASDDAGKNAYLNANQGQPPALPFEKLNVNAAQGQQQQQGQPQGQQQQAYGQQPVAQQQPAVQQQQPVQAVAQQPVAQPAAAPVLPPGWLAMQDPTSGRTYYANQQSGETTWEFPQAANPQQQQQQQPAYAQPAQPVQAAPTPAPVSQPAAYQQPAAAYQQPQPVQPVAAAAPLPGTPGQSLANKYGDGFVSSASNPALAAQYGNIGTANPYNGSARPGQADVAGPAGTLAPAEAPAPVQMDPAYQPIVDGLNHFLATLGSMQLLSSEKKQLAEVQKGVTAFIAKLGTGGVDAGTCAHMLQLVQFMSARDYNNANVVNTTLANTVWKEHKDWLKGVKFLIQLVSKKM